MIYLWATFLFQPIVTISADDKDDTANGPRFIFSLPPEIIHNPNFTVRDNRGSYHDAYAFRGVEMGRRNGEYMVFILQSTSIFPNLNTAFLLTSWREVIMRSLFWDRAHMSKWVSFYFTFPCWLWYSWSSGKPSGEAYRVNMQTTSFIFFLRGWWMLGGKRGFMNIDVK